MSPQNTHGRIPLVEVVITEELDFWSLPRFNATLLEALEMHPARLVVDVASCPRMDAAVIGLLLEVHREARRVGGQLMLRSPSPRLMRNLRLARADRVLHVMSDAEAANPDADEAEAWPGGPSPWGVD